jgi:predicted RND superfamily exporter protein
MIRWRWSFFAISLLLLVFALPASRRLSLDRSLHRMFAPGDPTRVDFELLQTRFGVSDLVVFAYRDPNLWNRDGSGIDRLEAIRQKIEAIPGVDIAMDLSKIDTMIHQLESPLTVFSSPKTRARHPILDTTNRLAMEFKAIFEGQTHGREGDLVAIACILASSASTKESPSKTISDIRELGLSLPEEYQVSSAMLVGQPVMVDEGFEAIEQDGLRLGYFSTLSLSLLILIGFRSLRWAAIAILVVQWSLIVTRGLLVWLAWDLTMVSSMLSSIVTVIGVATTMHWMLGYRNAMQMGLQPQAALVRSTRELWKPIVWACITDAIGFASLLFAKVGPVQDYGCMMALASLVVMFGIFALVPTLALVPLVPEKMAKYFGVSFKLASIPGDIWVRRWLGWLLDCALRFPRAVVTMAALLTGIAILGAMKLKVETDFIKNFKHDAPLVIAYRAIERELGGAGVWDVMLPAPPILTQAYFDEVIDLEKQLLSIEIEGQQPLRLSKVMSLADADAIASMSPILGRLPIEARLVGMRQVMGKFVDTLITKGDDQGRWLRVMLRSPEQSDASQKEQLIEEVRRVVGLKIQTGGWESVEKRREVATVSGYYVLLLELVKSVVADQWRCFAAATFGIWIAMAIALKSPFLSLLAIWPNALPSLCILGFMGWVGMDVNLGAAMIAAVSMGLSVDSSLHYLIRIQRERSQGKESCVAIQSAQSEIGMAMLLSTGALVVGFGALATSDFVPTIVFGVTASLSMLGGLVGNLLILPALLTVVFSKRNF